MTKPIKSLYKVQNLIELPVVFVIFFKEIVWTVAISKLDNEDNCENFLDVTGITLIHLDKYEFLNDAN